MSKSEVIERVNPDKPFPVISYNLPFPETCSKHFTGTLQCSKAFIIVSGSLSRTTDALQRLETALGPEQVVGVWKGMQPHTMYSEVLVISAAIKKAGADCIITVGGGSLIDGAKGMAFAIANDADTPEKLNILFKESIKQRQTANLPKDSETEPMVLKSSTISIICVTTTLSAGEYNFVGGATNDATKHKQLFLDPAAVGPKVIILDPSLTLTTPERVWLSTGLRAMDHCIESFASSNPSPEASVHCIKGIKLLIPSLLQTKKNPEDLDARLRAQLGSAESMKPHVLYRTRVGGSHGIGHQLGPYGVPHAETTCVCLPAVQKYNAKVNASRQNELVQIMWTEPTIASVLTKHSLHEGKADLGDALDAVIRELGFPRSLNAYGVSQDKLNAIAESSIEDLCCHWNVIPLLKKEQVLEILEMCIDDSKKEEAASKFE